MDEETQDKILLTVDEASFLTKLAPFTLRKWVREGRVPAVRIGRRIFFEIDRLIQWIRSKRI